MLDRLTTTLIAFSTALVAALVAPAGTPAAGERGSGDMVDVALILAVDVSGSIDARERDLQRQGYARAISSRPVVEAIEAGAHGRVLVAVVEWSDELDHEIRVPWTLVTSEEDTRRIASRIREPGSRIPHSSTSIAGALQAAAALFSDKPYEAERLVLDVSGDGKDYQLTKLAAARAVLLERGVTINGLPILASPDAPDLEVFYRDSVIGGPGAFIAPARSFEDLEPALIRKLVLELT